MDYNEICIKVKSADCDTAAAIANMTVPYGIYIEDYSDMEQVLPTVARVDYIDDELLAKDREHAKVHIYIPTDQNPQEAVSFIEFRLKSADIDYELETGKALESVFMNEWKKYYKPEKIGERLVIYPSWEKYEGEKGEILLSLDPESAFGTGKHETTRLCLSLLEESIKGGERALDMGTGSGILGIGALLLGAGTVTAVDIEPNSVKTAAENAAKNGFGEERFIPLCGDVLNDSALSGNIGDGYDVIAANIVADVIIAMASLFYDKLNIGGTLVASGIIDTRRDEVLSALTDAGFTAENVAEDGGWVAASLKKSAK